MGTEEVAHDQDTIVAGDPEDAIRGGVWWVAGEEAAAAEVASLSRFVHPGLASEHHAMP